NGETREKAVFILVQRLTDLLMAVRLFRLPIPLASVQRSTRPLFKRFYAEAPSTAAASKVQLTIATPVTTILKGQEVESVVLPGLAGEFEVCPLCHCSCIALCLRWK